MIIVIVVVVVCVVDGFAISSVRKQQQQRMFATATIPQIAQLLERTTSTRSCQRKRTNSFLARSTSTDVYSILNRKRFISLWSTSSSASSNNNNHPEPIFYNDFEDYNPHSNHKSAVPYNNNNNQNQKQGNNDHVSNEQVNDETWITMTDARSVGGDWRAFRRNLTQSEQQQTQKQQRVTTTVAKQNEKVLETQNESLAAEYRSGVWAHETSTVHTVSTRVQKSNDSAHAHTPLFYLFFLFIFSFFSVARSRWFDGTNAIGGRTRTKL